MLTFQNVSKCYANGNQALQDISFVLEKGELAFLVGGSGAGKSTILKLILGIERPSQGKVFVLGKDISKLSQRKIAKLRSSIGVIFQEPHLLDDHSIFDNVALPLELAGFRRSALTKRVLGALDMVGMLGREKELPLVLSFSERQRICIARAVVDLPQLVLADDPTHGLDYNLSKEIMQLLLQVNRVGSTVLVVTNDINRIPQSDRCQLFHLRQGNLLIETKGGGGGRGVPFTSPADFSRSLLSE